MSSGAAAVRQGPASRKCRFRAPRHETQSCRLQPRTAPIPSPPISLAESPRRRRWVGPRYRACRTPLTHMPPSARPATRPARSEARCRKSGASRLAQPGAASAGAGCRGRIHTVGHEAERHQRDEERSDTPRILTSVVGSSGDARGGRRDQRRDEAVATLRHGLDELRAGLPSPPAHRATASPRRSARARSPRTCRRPIAARAVVRARRRRAGCSTSTSSRRSGCSGSETRLPPRRSSPASRWSSKSPNRTDWGDGAGESMAGCVRG